MLKWLFLTTFSVIVATLSYLYFYLGGYRSVSIEPVLYPKIKLIYKLHHGPYHQVSSALKEVETWATNNHLKCEKTFGEYLDNPATVEEERLRSHVGCVVDQSLSPLPQDYFYREISERKVVRAEFYGAPSIGPFKVYPKVKEYLAEKRLQSSLPPIEIYQTQPNGEHLTEFLFPLDNNNTENNLIDQQEASLSQSEAIQRAHLIDNIQYDLEFDLTEPLSQQNNSDHQYSGTSQIFFSYKGNQNSSSLRIDFFKGKIQQLQINGEAKPFVYNGQFILIDPHQLKMGSNAVTIQFIQSYARNGRGFMHFTDPQDKESYTYTHLEPFDSNRVFPCFDQPDLKATYKMKVKAPSHWQVISSVRESAIHKISAKDQEWIFPESALFSTYVWSLHAGPYQVWKSQAGEISLRLFARKSLASFVQPQEWFTTTQKGLSFFNSYFAFPYPYKKYDQIVVPEFNFGAMENVGAVTFNEKNIAKGIKSNRDRMQLANTILHEMAHMWFGNLVTMKWWNDLWLNESFATYMASLALSEVTEFKEVAWRDFHREKTWAYWEDQLITTHPIEAQVPDTNQAFANFDGITYGKGASVIKQLAFLIGKDQFQNGVQKYIKQYAHHNATLSDFIGSLSDISHQNLTHWQKQWLKTASLNTIQAHWQCKNNKINQFVVQQSAPKEFPLLRDHRFHLAFFSLSPTKVKTSSQSSHLINVSKNFSVLFNQEKLEIKEVIGEACPFLVYPNHGDHAYMKVKLDETTVSHLLQSISHVSQPFDRQLFWQSLWDMMRDGDLEIKKFGELILQSLPQEKDPITLRSILTFLVGRNSRPPSVLYYLPSTNPSEKKIKKYFIEQVEKMIWQQLLTAPASSELQKIWLGFAISTTQTPQYLSQLRSLLDGKIKLKNLDIDQYNRWEIIKQLAAHNDNEAKKLIQQEWARDPSSLGREKMIAAEVSFPTWQTKLSWIQELLQRQSQYSFDQQRVVIDYLFPPHQDGLRQRYSNDFYKDLDSLLVNRDASFLEAFVDLAPDECHNKQEEKENISSFLIRHPHLYPNVEKNLKVTRQEYERCRHIQATYRNESK